MRHTVGRGPSPIRVVRPLVAATLLGAVPAGCSTLHFLNRPAPPPPEEAKRQAAVAAAVPGKYTVRIHPYVFLADFELKRDQPLFRELTELRDQVHRELKLPESNSLVHVYLFENKNAYEHFMRLKYPDLPRRRAFFVAQPKPVAGGTDDLLVYTYWGDRVREDLRHELTHALLHSVLKDVPLWLDEGLAEYFELPPDNQGVNLAHLGQAARGPGGAFKPDLARLEQLSQVSQMSPAEYRESWAWVHLMLRGRPEGKAVLLNYLQLLRTTPNPGPLEPRLLTVFTTPADALERHLQELNAQVRPAVARP